MYSKNVSLYDALLVDFAYIIIVQGFLLMANIRIKFGISTHLESFSSKIVNVLALFQEKGLSLTSY